MIKSIQDWLKNPVNYKDGVSLFHTISRNHALRRHFAGHPSPRRRQKLIYELNKYVKMMLPEDPEAGPSADEPIQVRLDPQPETVKPPPPPSADQVQPQIPISPPPASTEESLAIQKSKLYNQRAKLSNSLRDFPAHDDVGRKDVVDQILTISSQMSSIRDQEDQIKGVKPSGKKRTKTSQKLPIREEPIPSEDGDLMKMRLNLRSRISKARSTRKRQQPGTTRFRKYDQKLQDLLWLQEQVEQEIEERGIL